MERMSIMKMVYHPRPTQEEKFRLHVRKTLIELREKHGLRQHEVAQGLHIDRSTYSYYELGSTMPSLYMIHKIACFYDCPVCKFFP